MTIPEGVPPHFIDKTPYIDTSQSTEGKRKKKKTSSGPETEIFKKRVKSPTSQSSSTIKASKTAPTKKTKLAPSSSGAPLTIDDFLKNEITELYRDKPLTTEVPAYLAFAKFGDAFKEKFPGEEFPEKEAIALLGATNRQRRQLLGPQPEMIENIKPVERTLEQKIRNFILSYSGPMLDHTEEDEEDDFAEFHPNLRMSFDDQFKDTDIDEYYDLIFDTFTEKREQYIKNYMDSYWGSRVEVVGDQITPHHLMINFLEQDLSEEFYPTSSQEEIIESVNKFLNEMMTNEVKQVINNFKDPIFLTEEGKTSSYNPKFISNLQEHLNEKFKLPISFESLIPIVQLVYEEKVKEEIGTFVSKYLQPYVDGEITREKELVPRPILMELLQNHLLEKFGSRTPIQGVTQAALNAYMEKIASHFVATLGRDFHTNVFLRSVDPQESYKSVKNIYSDEMGKYLKFFAFSKDEEMKKFDGFVVSISNALDEAIPKDFPGITLNEEETGTLFINALLKVFKAENWEYIPKGLQ